MRLFYLINEPTINYQVGYRQTISKLIEEAYLSDCYFYSFLVKLKEFGLRQDLVAADIIKEVAGFKPDAILFAHTGNFNFDDAFFKELEVALGYKPVYAIDERDVYGRFVKRLPTELVKLSGKCDVTFLVCSGGWMFEQFQKHNSGKSIYLPHVCDEIHFGNRKPNGCLKKYDIVMLGNLHINRVPFNSMPGVKERVRVATALYKKFGKRFAVFGTGWENYPFSAGVVPFFEQEDVLLSSNLSVGVDHFLSYDQYFSDRLPISLLSGVPHLSWQTPKLDLLFKENEHIFYFKSVEECVLKSEAILSGQLENTAQVVSQAIDLVRSDYTEMVRMKKLIKYLNDTRVN